MRLLLISAIAALSAVTGQAVVTDGPHWYTNPPQSDDKLIGIGSGELKIRAVCDALNDLESKNKTITEGRTELFENDPENISSMATFESTQTSIMTSGVINSLDNDFQFFSKVESFFTEKGEDIIESFEMVMELKYQNIEKDEAAIINGYFLEKSLDGLDNWDVDEKFNVVYENLDDTKLIEKLVEIGLKFEFARGRDARHYVLVSISKDLLEKN